MGGVSDFGKFESVHGNAVRLARGRDTSLQQPRVLGVNVWRGGFIVRVWDVDGANLDTFSSLDLDLNAVGRFSVSFGHGEGKGQRR